MLYTDYIMKRNYEIAVISRGGYARTVRIFGGKNAVAALIVIDGSPLFECGTKYLFEKCRKNKIALIGIDCTERLDEYLPFKCENPAVADINAGGNADELNLYVTETLIPYLKKRFNINRFYMFGYSFSAAAALYISAHKGCGISAFGIEDAPLFISPKAFDGFFKTAEFANAGYFITCTNNPEILPEGTPQKVYPVSAVSIVAALINYGIPVIELQTKTDSATLAESVCDFIEFCNKAIIFE